MDIHLLAQLHPARTRDKLANLSACTESSCAYTSWVVGFQAAVTNYVTQTYKTYELININYSFCQEKIILSGGAAERKTDGGK